MNRQINRQTLLRVGVLAAAAVIAVLLIIGIVMAITRTGLFKTDGTPARTTQDQPVTGNANDGLPGDSGGTAASGNTSATTGGTTTPAANGTIPSTGPSDVAVIAAVTMTLFSGTYLAVLRLRPARR